MTERNTDRNEQQESQHEREERRRLSENVDEIVDEVNKTVRVAIVKSVDAAESIGENIRDTIQGMRGSRDNVVMVRVDKASLDRLDELVEAGIMGSRSEGGGVSDWRGREGTAAAVRQNRGEDTGYTAGEGRAAADGG